MSIFAKIFVHFLDVSKFFLTNSHDVREKKKLIQILWDK